MKQKLFTDDDMPLIRYELEVMRPGRHSRPVTLNAQFARMDRLARKDRKDDPEMKSMRAWLESEVPFFHPGRVLVSHDVMIRLGKMEVLFQLNCIVRGGGCDGPAAGEAIAQALYGDRLLQSVDWLTQDIALWITTNPARTRTVIRFSYERLPARRAAGERPTRQKSVPPGEESDDDIPF